MSDISSLTDNEALTKYGTLKKHSGVFLGVLGAAAGAVSAVLPEEFQPTLEPLGRALFLDGFIIHPALLFSPVIAYGIWAFGGLAGRKKWIGAGLAFLMALAGWVLDNQSNISVIYWCLPIDHSSLLPPQVTIVKHACAVDAKRTYMQKECY